MPSTRSWWLPSLRGRKPREQELADRVKSLDRLRSQEATHKGQIHKLELDLERHCNMPQGVLSRIWVESEECDGLNASGEAIPPTQRDSQLGNDMSGQAASEEGNVPQYFGRGEWR